MTVEPATPLVLVEGESDAIVVRTLVDARGGRCDVVPMGGVTNLAAHLEQVGGPAPGVFALVDAGEVRFATGALRRFGIRAASVDELAWHGVFVCDRDLEDVLFRAVGLTGVRDELERMGELGSFEKLLQMPQWRGRDVEEALRRFAGSGAGRKARLATRLSTQLDPLSPPSPLDELIDRVLDAGSRGG